MGGVNVCEDVRFANTDVLVSNESVCGSRRYWTVNASRESALSLAFELSIIMYCKRRGKLFCDSTSKNRKFENLI